VVFNGKAHFRSDAAGKCLASLEDRPGCTAFINTGANKSLTPRKQESATPRKQESATPRKSLTAGALKSFAGIPIATALVPAYSVVSSPATTARGAAAAATPRLVDEGCAPRRPRVSSGVLSPNRRRPDMDRVSSGSVPAPLAKDPVRPTSRQVTPRPDALRPASRHVSPTVERCQAAEGLQREATWSPGEQRVPTLGLQREATWAPESGMTVRGAGALPAVARPSPRWRKLEPALHSSRLHGSRSHPVMHTVRDHAWSHREHVERVASPKPGRQTPKAVQGWGDAVIGMDGRFTPQTGMDGRFTPPTGGGGHFELRNGRTSVGEQVWRLDDRHATKAWRLPKDLQKDGKNFIEVPVPDRESCHCVVQ